MFKPWGLSRLAGEQRLNFPLSRRLDPVKRTGERAVWLALMAIHDAYAAPVSAVFRAWTSPMRKIQRMQHDVPMGAMNQEAAWTTTSTIGKCANTKKKSRSNTNASCHRS